MKELYVVIEDVESSLYGETKYYFETWKEARKYLDRIIEERNDLEEDYGDSIFFGNDDLYAIIKIVKGEIK